MRKTYRKYVRCSVCKSKIYEGDKALIMDGELYCNERCACDKHWDTIDINSIGTVGWHEEEIEEDDFDADGYNDDKKLGLI